MKFWSQINPMSTKGVFFHVSEFSIHRHFSEWACPTIWRPPYSAMALAENIDPWSGMTGRADWSDLQYRLQFVFLKFLYCLLTRRTPSKLKLTYLCSMIKNTLHSEFRGAIFLEVRVILGVLLPARNDKCWKLLHYI